MNRRKHAINIAFSSLINLTENSTNEVTRYNAAIAILNYASYLEDEKEPVVSSIDLERERIENMYRKPI